MYLSIWIFSLIALIISYRKDKQRTLESLSATYLSLKKMSRGILLMVFVVGAMLAAIPKERLAAIFSIEGIGGFAIVSFIGALVTIPGPIAFPLAGQFLELGTSLAILASFITTLTMVGIVTAPLEISYFGRRFTLIRQSLSFIAAIIIGLIMSVLV